MNYHNTQLLLFQSHISVIYDQYSVLHQAGPVV